MNTRKIAETGIFLALYIVICFIDNAFSGMVIDFFLPIPIAIITYKYGIKYGLFFLVGGLLLFFPINPYLALYYTISLNSLGLVYALLLRKNKFNEKQLIVVSALIYFISSLISFLLIARLFNLNTNEMKIFFDEIINRLPISMSKERKELVSWSLLIEFYLLFALIYSYFIHQLIIMAMNRLKIATIQLTPFLFLRFPRKLAWIAVSIIGINIIFLVLGIKYDNFWTVGIIFAVLSIFILFLYYIEFCGYLGMRLLAKNQRGLFMLSTLIFFLVFYIFGLIRVIQRVFFKNDF